MHIYRPSPGSLSPLPLLLYSQQPPSKSKLVPVYFGARKFSIKGENWIALMLICDHNLKKTSDVLEKLSIEDASGHRTRDLAVVAHFLNHSATTSLFQMKLFCLNTPHSFFGYIAKIFWVIREGTGKIDACWTSMHASFGYKLNHAESQRSNFVFANYNYMRSELTSFIIPWLF